MPLCGRSSRTEHCSVGLRYVHSHCTDEMHNMLSKTECKREAIMNAGQITSNTQNAQWLKSLKLFCSDVSVLGLRYVANSSASAYRRLLWVLLILAGVAFTTFQIQDRIRRYFDYPVNVVIHEKHMKEMTFPTVTICNENRASLSKMSSLGKSLYSEYCNYLLAFGLLFTDYCNYQFFLIFLTMRGPILEALSINVLIIFYYDLRKHFYTYCKYLE